MNIIISIGLVAYIVGFVVMCGLTRRVVLNARRDGIRVPLWRVVMVPLGWPVWVLMALGDAAAQEAA